MYKTLLLIFLSIIISSCFNKSIEEKKGDIKVGITDESINGGGFGLPKAEKSTR